MCIRDRSKYFDKGLTTLGAERIYKVGEGNAEGNHTEDDFNEWKKTLWRDLFLYYKSKEEPGQNQEE